MTDQPAAPARPGAVRVVDAQPITPTNEALYEAGKAILLESITVGREFCKFMITTSTGAIPIYLAVLTFVLPQHYTLSPLQELTVVLAGFFFLIAALVFAIGYFPSTARFSLDMPDQIEARRADIIKKRRNWAIAGFSCFSTGVVLSLLSVVAVIHTR